MAPSGRRIVTYGRALAENIAFLGQSANQERALSEPVIDLLRIDRKRRKEETEKSRSLTFDEKRQLAEVFALMSATSDRTSRVDAICVEEQPHCGGLVVRFAANLGSLEHEEKALFDET